MDSFGAPWILYLFVVFCVFFGGLEILEMVLYPFLELQAPFTLLVLPCFRLFLPHGGVFLVGIRSFVVFGLFCFDFLPFCVLLVVFVGFYVVFLVWFGVFLLLLVRLGPPSWVLQGLLAGYSPCGYLFLGGGFLVFLGPFLLFFSAFFWRISDPPCGS